eukprot:485148-Pyramimonas_sp.AAC.1
MRRPILGCITPAVHIGALEAYGAPVLSRAGPVPRRGPPGAFARSLPAPSCEQRGRQGSVGPGSSRHREVQLSSGAEERG